MTYTLRPCELVRGVEPPIVEGRDFEDVMFKGPAVIAFMGTVTLRGCRLGGSPKNQFIPVRRNTDLLGVIGFRDCTFTSCRFQSIGIAATNRDIKKWVSQLQQGRRGNSRAVIEEAKRIVKGE